MSGDEGTRYRTRRRAPYHMEHDIRSETPTDSGASLNGRGQTVRRHLLKTGMNTAGSPQYNGDKDAEGEESQDIKSSLEESVSGESPERLHSVYEETGLKQHGIDSLQKAAALLASFPCLFQGFCDPCSLLLHKRLLLLSSGQMGIPKGQGSCGHSSNNTSGGRADLELVEEDGTSLQMDMAHFLNQAASIVDETSSAHEAQSVSANEDTNNSSHENKDLFAVTSDIHEGLEVSISQPGTDRRRPAVGLEAREESEDKSALKTSSPQSREHMRAGKERLRAEKERLRLLGLKRKKDFVCMERIQGRLVNVAEGLELHTGVFSVVEQARLVNMVHEFQNKGRRQELHERTYSEPRKWMRGKGRITIQFGCCYNYAVDKYGNLPGIFREEAFDPIPSLLRNVVKCLVRWHVLPPTCVPDSCIINIYEEGDCIPPHIDHHDFLRPFCTLSLLSVCDIVFGSNLKVVGPGEFDGPLSIPLPVGSVLVLNGNGADVAKHAVPAVPSQRISITFRKMDPSKVPVGFVPDHDLQDLRLANLPSPHA